MATSTNPGLGAPPSTKLCELGVLGVEVDGAWSAVRGPRMSMLLAALGLAGRSGIRAEELTETIWPSPEQPPTARQSLANIVLRLRASYGAGFVESTHHGYRIGDQVQSDRERFVGEVEHAAELVAHAPERALELVAHALARWRGDPWLGLEAPIGVEADRAHLQQVRASALRIRATALVALDRRELAIPTLRELLEADPFDEPSRHQLVRILSESGGRAEALRAIHDARRLFSERGLVLDQALVDQERRLLSVAFASVAERAPLPEQPTDFVGREHEMDEIEAGLRSGRLVTLVGTGGAGKTRLAVHVARRLYQPSHCGFVDLARARSRAQVDLAFARGLGLPSNQLDGLDADERVEVLVDAGAGTSGVLVIDNCEHVLGDVRDVVVRLLARPGDLRLLATSRIPLDVAGEHRYPIPSFTQAAELFRRRSTQRGVPLDVAEHPDTVARICELVDHLPLAIEIAAAQSPYRTVREIADELERGIVHRDPTQSEPRHETMTMAIRWSHEQLDPTVADALIRLGVFDSPFRRDDAAAAIGTGDTISILDTLVHHSLIERSDEGGRSSYHLTVPVRLYCAAELERRGATTDVLLALADWLLAYTEQPYGDVWWRLSAIDDLDPRMPHALSAIAALSSVGRIDDATRLASRLGGVARQFGRADELIEILTELWPDCNDAEATSDALVALAECTDAARRDELFDSSLGLLAALDEPVGRRHRVYVHCEHSLWLMWSARLTDEDYRFAEDELRRAREQGAALESPLNRALIEQWQSGLHLLRGDWDAAEAAARRALDDSFDSVFDLQATSCLCQARLQLDDPDEALRLAIRHPHRNRSNPHGDLLGIAAAIARVRRGDTDAGLADISRIQVGARRAPFAIQQDDAAIAIAYVAHLLHQDDLTARIIETGVVGYGPWIGYLVPKMCRDLRIPLRGHASKSDAERQARSDHYGAVASHTLRELWARHADDGPSQPPRR